MPRFKIYAGLGGGFGGALFQYEFDCIDSEYADEVAYEEACAQYEGYEGAEGIRSVDDIMEQDDVTEEAALEAWNEERESWLDYRAEEID